MLKYIVAENSAGSPTTLLLTLKPKNPDEVLSFVPGQYAAISFKRRHRPTAVRCFSIVTAPDDTGRLQFSMRTKGRYTRALTKLQSGDEVTIRGPFGGFVLDDAVNSPTVLLAGGIGITPFMSMIRHAAMRSLSTDLTLVYSVQSQEDIPFLEELQNISRINPNFHLKLVIGDGITDLLPEGLAQTGRLSPEILAGVTKDMTSTLFYTCGPPPFMNAARKMLRGLGAPNDNILTEAFGQGPNRQTGKERDWPFNIYVLGTTGVIAVSLVVMLGDFFKTLPPLEIVKQLRFEEQQETLQNQRQKDLDAAVNQLPDSPSSAPASSQTSAATTPTQSTAVTTVPVSSTPRTSVS